MFWKPSCGWDWGMSREWQEKRQVAGAVYEPCRELGLKSSREPSRNVCVYTGRGGGGLT